MGTTAPPNSWDMNEIKPIDKTYAYLPLSWLCKPINLTKKEVIKQEKREEKSFDLFANEHPHAYGTLMGSKLLWRTLMHKKQVNVCHGLRASYNQGTKPFKQLNEIKSCKLNYS